MTITEQIDLTLESDFAGDQNLRLKGWQAREYHGRYIDQSISPSIRNEFYTQTKPHPVYGYSNWDSLDIGQRLVLLDDFELFCQQPSSVQMSEECYENHFGTSPSYSINYNPYSFDYQAGLCIRCGNKMSEWSIQCLPELHCEMCNEEMANEPFLAEFLAGVGIDYKFFKQQNNQNLT